MEFLALMCVSLVAGLVSFTSPCTLPLLPGYVSYVSGLSTVRADERHTKSDRRRILGGAALFVAGFSSVFTALGATSSALGFLLAVNLRVVNLVGGILIVLMGLTMTGLVRIPLLWRQARFDVSRLGRGPAAALPLGAAFAFGWTPCVGPVLASILTTAASTATVGRGALLLLTYSLGLGVPFLLLAAGMTRGRTRTGWLTRHARRIETGGGLLLVAMGVAVASGGWTVLMSRVLGFYARFGWPPI